jgi:hypothetical protein
VATSDLNHGDEAVRLLAILVRRQAASQADAILELHRARFSSARIADLLGTTAGTVSVTVSKSKTPQKSKKPKA